jgi:hypothetical protein
MTAAAWPNAWRCRPGGAKILLTAAKAEMQPNAILIEEIFK